MDITESYPSLTFTTPLYGTSVPSSVSLYCKITITCPPEEHIELTLFDVAVSGQVGIFDVPPTGAGSIVFTCTGILNASTVIFSRHSSLLIDYSGTTGVLAKGRGFTAEARLAGGNSSNIDGFCGGTVSLSESLPSATITTPLYGLTSQFGLHLECTMHITSTPGTQVQLTFIDFETTASEGLAIYDQPLSTYNKIAYFSGKLDVRTTVSSSRGGLTLTYQDDSDLYNGQGYLSEASLLDIQPISLERACGGYVALNKNVLPRMTITSPLYGTSSPSNVTISCWWFFSNILRDRQIEVVLKNVGISGDERINVYDHPSTQSYLIASLSGPSADSIFTSTRYGLSIYLEDISPGANGGGFIIDARLQGTETTMSPTSSSNMLPTATTADVLSTKGAGEMTQSNPDTSITLTTSTSVSSSTTHALEENGTTPVDNLIGIAAGVASSVAVVILAIAIITLIAIRSRRKRHENGASAASGSSVKPPSPPPRGDGSRSHETTFTYGKDDGSLVDDVGDDHHYSRAVYSAIDNKPGDEEEDHYYMIPQSCEESDVITEGPTYINDHVTKPRRYLGQHVTHGNDTELV
ncbi:uncharacterized protein LOC121413881 isoform X1 [Lytechinus variegatus]|uniref:uncharacterized protein LOC121413881 isoform X1 n=1 Tax=Lytechinus variegatus TaxID=7654 RepID=UPI001BB22197|nr:uncharacterized protein LOC121413881 isoform X1 [Lytechinus variegatus]